jgi:hypothetical protein
VLKRISTNSPSSNWIYPFGWPSVAPSTFDTTTCLIGSNDEVWFSWFSSNRLLKHRKMTGNF